MSRQDRVTNRAVLVGVGCILLVLVAAVRLLHVGTTTIDTRTAMGMGCKDVIPAFQNRTSGTWLTVSGTVSRLLADSHGQFVHQRFILTCTSGQTLEIVNDVSLGSRVPLREGAPVAVRGQYVWNAQGGLLHFTHRGQSGVVGGWIVFGGRTYALPTTVDKAPDKEVEKRILAERGSGPDATLLF